MDWSGLDSSEDESGMYGNRMSGALFVLLYFVDVVLAYGALLGSVWERCCGCSVHLWFQNDPLKSDGTDNPGIPSAKTFMDALLDVCWERLVGVGRIRSDTGTSEGMAIAVVV